MSDEETDLMRQQNERLVPTKTSKVEVWDQKRRLASALRDVIENLVPSDAPVDELRRAADALLKCATQLGSHPRLELRMGYPEAATSGDTLAFFDQSPLIGLANPLAPPIKISVTGRDTALGEVTFASAYEGSCSPSRVHPA